MRRSRIHIVLALIVLAVIAGTLSVGPSSDQQDMEIDPAGRTAISEADGKAEDFPNITYRIITFGFDLRSSPEEDARQYMPFLRYLEKATGYYFKLHFAHEDGQLADDLGQGTVQLAAVGAGSFLKAYQRYGVIPLARGLNKDGKAVYQSVIVVAPDSAVEKLEDLAGKSLAFGGVDSTQGHFIPRIALEKAGIKLTDLAAYDYTGSHRNCAEAVISGQFDACAMQDTMGRVLAREGRVKIIYTSDFFPSSGIAGNKDLPPDVVKKIRKALIEFDPKGRHSEGLYNWHGTEMANGFEIAKLENYADFLTRMNRLGLLKLGRLSP